MSWSEFAFIGIACAATILICRVVPVFALRGRDLPGWLSQALAFIPPAAFAALISNDLLAPGMFDAGFWPAAIPFIAAAAVTAVAIKTKSLVWCIIVGVGVLVFCFLSSSLGVVEGARVFRAPFIVSGRFRFLGVLSHKLSGVNSGGKLPPMINL